MSPPDIDVDFCEIRREEVLDYVSEKYGSDRVAQILTLGTLQAKLAVRDVARMLEVPGAEIDRLAKLIPDGVGLEQAFEREPRLKEAVGSDRRLTEIFEIAKRSKGWPGTSGRTPRAWWSRPAPSKKCCRSTAMWSRPAAGERPPPARGADGPSST